MEGRLNSPLLAQSTREDARSFGPLVGESPSMRALFSLIGKFAGSDATVLITGESGTGKELVARALHSLGPRAQRPFVPVNCAAIPDELLESELFGHVRGAFTGAINGRQGRFQLAHTGTVFLDEIGEMTPRLQAKLLRVLQERNVEPVGSDRVVRVDVRVVAATNRKLRRTVEEGRFREDLFYRLNVLPMELPTLRQRPGDVPLLIDHFLRLQAKRRDAAVAVVEEAALARMQAYPWPGNVRELENLIQRLVVLSDGGPIRAADLPDYVNAPPDGKTAHAYSQLSLPPQGLDLDGLLQRIENGLIRQALTRSQGNKTVAAELLRVNRTTLIERIRKRGIEAHPQGQPNGWPPVRTMTGDDLSLTT